MKIKLLSISIAAIILSACGSSSKEGGPVHKPSSRGQAYELVVITPRQQYPGELQDTLESILLASTPVLNQHEPLFRLNIVYADANQTPWRTFRNRLIIKIDASAKEPSIGVAHDVIARPQIEVMVTGPTAHEIAAFVVEKRQRLTDLFVDAELEWQAAQLRRKYSKMTYEALQEMAGHTICVPQGLRASKVGQDFLWTGTNLNDKDQNFVFYSYPWNGQPLTPEQFVTKRDSAMKANIPGSQPNQWMQTAMNPDGREPLILTRARIINKCAVLEVHGLWEMHNGAIGGAFVAMERIDTANARVLVTEGFIYSPHSPKRNLMREMEAALRTFK